MKKRWWKTLFPWISIHPCIASALKNYFTTSLTYMGGRHIARSSSQEGCGFKSQSCKVNFQMIFVVEINGIHKYKYYLRKYGTLKFILLLPPFVFTARKRKTTKAQLSGNFSFCYFLYLKIVTRGYNFVAPNIRFKTFKFLK